jgi:NADH-quinone oxidoreductase subunit M
MAGTAGLSVILGAVYMLSSYRKISLGETNPLTETFKELTFHEKAVLIPLVIMIFFIGIYPKPILDLTEPSVRGLLEMIQR